MAKKAMLCPRCRRIIGSNEDICSWCGTSRANPWWKVMGWTRGNLGEGWAVQAIIAVNIIFYILTLLLSSRHNLSFSPLGFLSPDQRSLLLLGATGRIPIDDFGRPWTLLSANYLHGGLLHILFNLMALRQIAPLVIHEYGTNRMFTIYTVGGVCGYAVSYLAGTPFTIGASAAVCALIGSLLYYGKSRGGAYGAAVFHEVWGWVVGLFVFGLIMPGIDNWAHGGGILGGVLVGMLLGYKEKRRETSVHSALTLACATATIVALAWAMISSVAAGLVHLRMG
ncbi:MAG TPA: rhomboid family intramembrane serine protease [Geobacteraceae bacterium]